MSNQRYMQRGVSASKEDVHNAIKNIDTGVFPKAFCKIIPDILGGDPEYCNIMHADGAGTKSSLAYLYWKETGDLSGQQVLYGTGSTSAVPEYDAAAEAMTSRSLCLPLPVGQDRSISRSCRVNAGSRKPEL